MQSSRTDEASSNQDHRSDADVLAGWSLAQLLHDLHGARHVDIDPLGDVRSGERRLHHRLGHRALHATHGYALAGDVVAHTRLRDLAAETTAMFPDAAGMQVSHDEGRLLTMLVQLTGAMVALLVPLIQGQDAGWPLWTWLTLGGGVVLLVLFALWERRVAARGSFPIVPPRLFAHGSFAGGVLLALVYFAAFTSIFFSISIFWQAGLGHTALESALVSVPFAVGLIVGAAQSNQLADRLGRTVLVLGTALVAVGLIGTWLVVTLVPATEITNWELLGPLLIAGVGSGLFIAPNVQFIVATVDRSDAGAASGVVGTSQRVGSAIGIAVIGSLFFGNLVIEPAVPGPPTSAELAIAFGHSASVALLASAIFAVVAFLLVFALPRRVASNGAAPDAG